MTKANPFNQINLLLILSILFYSCNSQGKSSPQQDNLSGSNPIDNKQSSPVKLGDGVLCAIMDKAGNLWFGTSDNGVYRYNPAAKHSAGEKSFTHFSIKEGLCSNIVQTMYEDRLGRIWFGTPVGICFCDGKNLDTQKTAQSGGKPVFTTFDIVDTENDTASKSSNNKTAISVVSIYEQKDGRLMFGTLNNGLFRYDHTTVLDGKKGFKHSFKNERIQGIIEDNNGMIWAGNNQYDGKFFISFTENDGAMKEAVTCTVKDNKGKIWFGTNGAGLYRYDETNFTHFSEKDGLCNDFIASLYVDKSGNIWIGSNETKNHKEGSLCVYNVSSKQFEIFPTEKNPMHHGISTILGDHEGNIWFGTSEGELFRYDPLADLLKSKRVQPGGSPTNKVGFTDFSDEIK